MSIIKEGKAICSHCSQATAINVYASINVAQNPELKAKVMDGSLFLWECPSCGTVNLSRYETLYHDPEKKLMVWLMPEGEISESQMQAITMHTKAMGGYVLRTVSDMGSLMEKVLIHEAGLDDVVIEMCKFVTAREMGKNLQFKFFKIEGEGDDRLITLMYPENGNMNGVNLGWNVYTDCLGILQRNPVIRPAEGFVRIDSDWLYSIMK